jgi:dipeptidyl-peptidase-4
MSTSIFLACVGLGILATSLSANAAGDEPTRVPAGAAPSALKNVEFLEQYAATRGFTHGTPKNISITPDGAAVFFLRSGPRSFVQDLFVVDTATGQESVFLTADKILAGGEEKLTAEELARRERMRSASRGIASYIVSKDGKRVLVPLSGRLFVIERDGAKAGSVTELKSTAGYPIDPQFSPDATKVACVRDGDLYVMEIASGTETRLTTKKSETVTNGLAEFVAQEEMDRFHGFWWSPDSKLIAFEESDTAGMEMFHIADAVNPEKEGTSWPYPRPGKKNAKVNLGVIDLSTKNVLWIEWDYKWREYLANVAWTDEAPLCLTVMSRDQKSIALVTAYYVHTSSPMNVMTRSEETDAAWINLRPNIPHNPPSSLVNGGGTLWITERRGAPMLSYSLESQSGVAERWTTPADFGLQSLVGTSTAFDAAFVLASKDPTQTSVYAVSLDNGQAVNLTPQPGVHGLVLAGKSSWGVVSSTTLAGDSTWTVRDLKAADPGHAIRLTRETPPWVPNLELDVVGDKAFHAAIIRPRDFDAAKKYPVIVNVYGGPHHQMVRATPQAFYLQQWIADQGFIVVAIDGRGTPGRGRDWERAIKNDLIGPALEDQVAGLKALGAKHKEMDLDHVGIYGWSFGGYFSAMATMQRPDVFQAGCAGAPVCDWLDYDTCYTERYLGVPKGPDDAIYKKSSVLTYCKDLKRPLMIIHGTSDDNVYFMHSLKMTQALFREGKPFEFLPLAGFTHSVPDPVVTTRLYSRVAMFFKEKLGEPK